MKHVRPVLIILLALMSVNVSRADDIPKDVKQRAQADLKGKCLDDFLAWGRLSVDFVFAVGELNSKQYCGGAKSNPMWGNLDATKKEAIAACESVRPQGGPPCKVYAHNNDIVFYVSDQDRLKTAKKLIEAGEVLAGGRALNAIRLENLSSLTPTEKGEYEYLHGKVLLKSEAEQPRDDRLKYIIGWFNHSWSTYGNVNGAIEEGNLLMIGGDIANNWKLIRKAYKYFLANASDAEKSQHPEVERNLKQTEPYYLADLAQLEEAAKEKARLDAINAKQQEKIRKAEAKRIAKEGDGSEDDKTCQSYGARPGSQVYVNCRIQLGIAKQVADEQRAAQRDAQASQAEYNRRLEAARQEAQTQRDAADERGRQGAALRAIGGEIIRNSTPPPQPPSDRVRMNCITQGNTTQCY